MSNPAPPARWLVFSAAKLDAYTPASQFAAGGYPDVLTATGMTHADIDALRPAVAVLTGARPAIESQVPAFLQSLNLVM